MTWQKIISTKFDYNMVDSWTVYLLIMQHFDGSFEIGGAQYEVLGLTNDFYNDVDEIFIPSEIGGKRVVGIEGSYVVGGELSLEFSQYTTLRFFEINRDEIIDWLDLEGWSLDAFDEIEFIFKEITKS